MPRESIISALPQEMSRCILEGVFT